MPKISVIVPIYGVEAYIEQCAMSLFEQTLDDLEFIFIDDCTPDKSMTILSSVIEKYRSRITHNNWIVKLARMQTNSGQAAVRKYGIQLATGDYIIHCDSDDWICSNMYKILYQTAKDQRADLVFCDYYIYKTDSSWIVAKKGINDTNKEVIFKRTLIKSSLNSVWSALASKELYKRILFPVGDQSEDKTMIIQLCYYSKKVIYYGQPLYYYRINPDSISRTKSVPSIIRRYVQIQANRNIIHQFAQEQDLLIRYRSFFDTYFYMAKDILLPYLKDKKCRELWLQTDPRIHGWILFNPHISFRDKILYILNRIKCAYLSYS